MLDTVFCGSPLRDIEIKTFKESTYHQQSANVSQFEKHSVTQGGEKHTTAWVSKSSSPTPPLLLCEVQQMILVIDYASIPRYAATLRRLKKSAYFLDKKSVIKHVWPKLYYKAELSSILVKLNLNSRLTDH